MDLDQVLEHAIALHLLNDDNCSLFMHEQVSFIDFTGAGVAISDATLLRGTRSLFFQT